MKNKKQLPIIFYADLDQITDLAIGKLWTPPKLDKALFREEFKKALKEGRIIARPKEIVFTRG